MYNNFGLSGGDNLLFCRVGISDVISNQENHLRKEIQSLAENVVLTSNINDYADFLYEKLKLNLPELGNIALEEHPAKLDVSRDPLRNFMRTSTGPLLVDAQEFRLCISFTGDAEMLYVQPTTFTLNPPVAKVKNDEIHISILAEQIEPADAKKEFELRLHSIQAALDCLRPSVESFNHGLKSTALGLLTARRAAILKRQQIAETIGFPLRRRSEGHTYEIPLARKKLTIQKPKASNALFKPEPTLEIDTYEHIIDVICKVARMMEYSPHIFERINEEDLRTHFLIQLNGHYESAVSGETFNGEGKTDILVRGEGDGNLFVGECKYWRGEKSFGDTIDQLLGYVTWRDTKTAILIFCKNKNASAVFDQIAPLVRTHPNFKRDSPFKSDMGSRFVMSNKNDPGKEFLLTVLFFSIPTIGL